jgi:hypothetical protein
VIVSSEHKVWLDAQRRPGFGVIIRNCCYAEPSTASLYGGRNGVTGGLCPVLLDRWNEGHRIFFYTSLQLKRKRAESDEERKRILKQKMEEEEACSYNSGAIMSALNQSEALHYQLQSLFDELQ